MSIFWFSIQLDMPKWVTRILGISPSMEKVLMSSKPLHYIFLGAIHYLCSNSPKPKYTFALYINLCTKILLESNVVNCMGSLRIGNRQVTCIERCLLVKATTRWQAAISL